MNDGRTYEERKADMQLEQEKLDKEHEREKATKHDELVHWMERGIAYTVAIIVLSLLFWSLYQFTALPEEDSRHEFPVLVIHLILGATLPLTAGGLWTKWRDRG